jgi:hypothetical protein
MLVAITIACVTAAAQTFTVPQVALWTILQTEHGQVGACTLQASGRHDCGPAQVDAEVWVPYFSTILNRPAPLIYTQLRDNGCFNIYAAALILREKVDEAGGNLWDGMGRYNSATPVYKYAYQTRLMQSYRWLSRGIVTVPHRKVPPPKTVAAEGGN